MENLFGPKIGEVRLEQSRGGSSGGSVVAAAISGVADLGVAVAGLVGGIRDRKAIKGFQGELDAVGEEASAFTKEFKRISGELDESSDKAQISQLHEKLSSLQMGKTQFGDRASFRTKAGVALKKFLANSPHLADEASSLYNASSFGTGVGGVGGVSEGVSVLEQQIAKEEEEVSQVMVDLNISREQARSQLSHSKRLLASTQQGVLEITEASQNRVSVFAGMLKVTNGSAAAAHKTVMQQVLTTIANPDLTFDSVTSLGIYDQQMSLMRMQRQAILQKQGAGALTAEELKSLDNNVASWRANLEALLTSKDPSKAIKRQADRQAVIDLETFNNLVTSTFGDGETSSLIRLMGGQAGAPFMITIIPQIILAANGKSPQQLRLMMKAALELGETHKAAAIGLLIDGKLEGYYSSLANATGKVPPPSEEGGSESTESFMDKVTGMISSRIIKEEISPDVEEKVLKPLLMSAFSSRTTAALTNLMQPGSLAAVLNNPAMIKHTNNLIDRQMFDIADTLEFTLPEGLEIVIDTDALSTGSTHPDGKPKSLFRLLKVGSAVPLRAIPRIPLIPGGNVREINKLIKDLDYLSALAAYKEKINLSSRRDTLTFLNESLSSFTERGEVVKGRRDAAAKEAAKGDAGKDFKIPPLPPEDQETLEFREGLISNKKPFSFLSTATPAELATLKKDAKDEELLKAVEEELKRRERANAQVQ